MYKKVLLSLLLSSNLLFAQNGIKIVGEFKEVTNKDLSYVNINSNVPNTKIYLDDILIGEAPLEAYEIEADKLIHLKAVANEKIYPKAIEKDIKLKPFRTRTIDLNFKKGFAKLLLIGKDGYLFVDDRFDRTLTSNNRVVTIEAGKQIKIKIKNGEEQFVAVKDFYANKFYQFDYSLKKKASELKKRKQSNKIVKKRVDNRVVKIGNLMWEQVKEPEKHIFMYKEADQYCNSLNLLGYNTWRLPTIDELKDLDKKRFTYPLTDKYYWSGTSTKGKYVYWQYALAKDFVKNKVEPKIKTFYKGSTMCVRELNSTHK